MKSDFNKKMILLNEDHMRDFFPGYKPYAMEIPHVQVLTTYSLDNVPDRKELTFEDLAAGRMQIDKIMDEARDRTEKKVLTTYLDRELTEKDIDRVRRVRQSEESGYYLLFDNICLGKVVYNDCLFQFSPSKR